MKQGNYWLDRGVVRVTTVSMNGSYSRDKKWEGDYSYLFTMSSGAKYNVWSPAKGCTQCEVEVLLSTSNQSEEMALAMAEFKKIVARNLEKKSIVVKKKFI